MDSQPKALPYKIQSNAERRAIEAIGILDAWIADQSPDIFARSFAEEVLPGALVERDAVGQTELVLGASAFRNGHGGGPADIDALDAWALRQMKPGEDCGRERRSRDENE